MWDGTDDGGRPERPVAATRGAQLLPRSLERLYFP